LHGSATTYRGQLNATQGPDRPEPDQAMQPGAHHHPRSEQVDSRQVIDLASSLRAAAVGHSPVLPTHRPESSRPPDRVITNQIT